MSLVSKTSTNETRKKRDEFSEAYTLYYPLILNTINSKIENYHEANDVCQEVFMAFYNKFDEIREHRKWLFGTLRNKLIDYYRKKSNDASDVNDFFDDISLTFVNGFRDTRILIEEAIDSVVLEEQDRLLFDYIAINNYSYTNVGKILGLSKRQIGYKYLAIVKKILSYLQSKGIHDIGDLL